MNPKLRMSLSLKMVVVAGAVQAVAGLVMGNAVQGLMGAIVAYLAYRLGELAVSAKATAHAGTALLRYNEMLILANKAQSELIHALIEENHKLNVAAGHIQPQGEEHGSIEAGAEG